MTWQLIRCGSCGPVIHGMDFVGIDFGSAYSQHSFICQMGLVMVRDGIPGKTHAHCVFPRPGRQNFGHHNISIHGITRQMVDNADGSGLMLPRLAAFTGDLPLVARNVLAERSMIRTFEAIGVVPPPSTSDCSSALPSCTCPGRGPRTLAPAPQVRRVRGTAPRAPCCRSDVVKC